ncbi:hypothetical protein Ccrd_013021, partial [Cynara cardunculus var. scolymus]
VPTESGKPALTLRFSPSTLVPVSSKKVLIDSCFDLEVFPKEFGYRCKSFSLHLRPLEVPRDSGLDHDVFPADFGSTVRWFFLCVALEEVPTESGKPALTLSPVVDGFPCVCCS